MVELIVLGAIELTKSVVGLVANKQERNILRDESLILSRANYEDVFPSYLTSQSKTNLIVMGIISMLIVLTIFATIFGGNKKTAPKKRTKKKIKSKSKKK